MRVADYINALPDSYQKGENSNNYKLLSLEERLVAALRADIEAVHDTLDINKAYGKTLDLYGEIYGQPRGSMTDEQYRIIILQRIARNNVKGDYNSVVESLAVAFGVPTSEIVLLETDSPCEVEVKNLPYSVLQNAGLTIGQLQSIVLALLPIGVSLAPVGLEGTFEFAELADEYDENAGFGNSDQTIGGYFGLMATDDVVVPE